MVEVERDAQGRIEKVKIPMGKEATAENAKKIQAHIVANDPQVRQAQKLALAKDMDQIKEKTIKRMAEKQTLDMRKVKQYVNRHLDAGKTGSPERFTFMKRLPEFWIQICDLGDDDQKAWVKKRLLRFGKDFGFDIELPDDPKNIQKIIAEATKV